MKPKTDRNDRARQIAIIIVSAFVISTGALLFIINFGKGDFWGSVLGSIIALIILGFAILTYKRGNRDLKQGLPLKDERSERVLEKASSRTFYVSLYVLLAIGLMSDVVQFRDISQATNVAVGCMALVFSAFWIYYERKEF
jgi:uncharacterized membrane protein